MNSEAKISRLAPNRGVAQAGSRTGNVHDVAGRPWADWNRGASQETERRL